MDVKFWALLASVLRETEVQKVTFALMAKEYYSSAFAPYFYCESYILFLTSLIF